MSTFGVTAAGYVRKPLATTLSDIEEGVRDALGAGVVQTPQTHIGQLNGLIADIVAEIDQKGLDVFQSNDPAQAEGNNLDTVAKLRFMARGASNDEAFRKRVINANVTRYENADFVDAVKSIDGVTFARVVVNESGATFAHGQVNGSVALIVTGGDDTQIITAIKKYVIPGISTYGDDVIDGVIDGVCWSANITRPSHVAVTVNIDARIIAGRSECPPPTAAAISQIITEGWNESRVNGMGVDAHALRSHVERAHSDVEIVTVTSVRDGGAQQSVTSMAFDEIADINVAVTLL